MEDYSRMYYCLFNKITDIIKALEEVQKLTEEMFVNQAENKDKLIPFQDKHKNSNCPDQTINNYCYSNSSRRLSRRHKKERQLTYVTRRLNSSHINKI